MLKLTFEGDTLAELNGSISSYLEEIGTGGSPASAATGTSKKKTTAASAPKKATTLEDVQKAITDNVIAGKVKPAQVKALLGDKFMAFDGASSLEEAEYDNFIAELNAL